MWYTDREGTHVCVQLYSRIRTPTFAAVFTASRCHCLLHQRVANIPGCAVDQAVLSHDSPLVGKTLGDSLFVDLYAATSCGVLLTRAGVLADGSSSLSDGAQLEVYNDSDEVLRTCLGLSVHAVYSNGEVDIVVAV